MAKCFLFNILSGLMTTLIFSSSLYAQRLQDFVVFGLDSVVLSRGVKVNNGYVGSNGSIEVERDGRLEADIFGNQIKLLGEAIVAGNAHFNHLQSEKGAIVRGEKIEPLTVPIFNLPPFANFQTGPDNLIVPKNSTFVIEPGNFATVDIGQESRVTFSGGVYNIQKLRIHRDTKISFSALTTINLQQELIIERNSSLAGGSVGASQVSLNYAGTNTVTVGRNTMLYANMLAPLATLVLERDGDYRGIFAAKKVLVERDVKLALEDAFAEPVDLTKVVTDAEGASYPVNRLVMTLFDNATRADADEIAASIRGIIVGFVPGINVYEIEVPASTANQLTTIILGLENSGDPRIRSLLRNYILNIASVPSDLAILKAHPKLGNLAVAYEKIKIIEAWDTIGNRGTSPVTIGVIDTGVDAKHQEFKDPNVILRGSSATDLTDSDPDGHGTQVAGIIGANNRVGAGLPWRTGEMNGIVSGVPGINYALEVRSVGIFGVA